MTAAALLALLVLSGLVAHPADASSAGLSLDCNAAGQCAKGTGAAVALTADPVGGAVAFVCAVEAPGAATVGITSCTADVIHAPAIAWPGPVGVTTGFATVTDPESRVEVCWEASATFVLGAGTVHTSGCSILHVHDYIPKFDVQDPGPIVTPDLGLKSCNDYIRDRIIIGRDAPGIEEYLDYLIDTSFLSELLRHCVSAKA